MKFTLSWLQTHLDTAAPLAEITDTLTRIGLELEGVEDRGAALAPFRIAHVVEAVPHPNADRLRACKVDTGDGDRLRRLRRAERAHRHEGRCSPPPGSFIPGTGITLKVGEIRGVKSAGMLLSEREMGLGEDHSGIIELPDDAPVGAPYAAWAGLDDPVIDIGVTPNRGDCLRRARRGARPRRGRDRHAEALRTRRRSPRSSTARSRWRIDWPEACPWMLGRTMRGVRNGPSPQWLQDRLTAIGLRPINALVDVTNFFTIDLGRPLHVFDAGKVAGDALILRPGAGETLPRAERQGLHRRPARTARSPTPPACSRMAGVMGGEATGCDEATTTVFVECALFDPVRVALTGRRHGRASDARQRFERGIDPGADARRRSRPRRA